MNSYFERSSSKDDLYFLLCQTSTTMYCLRHFATLFFFTGLSRAAPQNDDRKLQQREPRDVPKIPRDFGEDVLTHPAVVVVTTTNYETMPVGTYTETISEGAIRVIVVVDATATSKVECPAECDCSRIKDKESDEYFQCITNPNCRPCREPGLTSTSSSPTPTPTCPAYCDCSKIKDKESDEVGGPPNMM
ncbi:hypothetical protein CDV31_002671 [Fusarium ambrosium]|uniref:Uncharacterized protein n=1 Tax=Fusarium ambrosium TaxID=131363 RepID=A0A428UW67_9HYPO|nr:hypothetical protein CDV31_002671 [Fusarium ambrosium]